MAERKKYYVVWAGRETGVFGSWSECEAQTKGYKGALYKGFATREEAERAFESGYEAHEAKHKATPVANNGPQPQEQAIAVDAACAGNPGKMEYRGVFVATGTEVFRSKVYEGGTNNIGEFLAIVHCLAWQHKNKLNYPIYSDSVNGMKWVALGLCRTKLKQTEKNSDLFDVVHRAEQWLRTNDFRLPLIKWRTELWGEIPADFGRK